MCATRRVQRSVSKYYDESDRKETDGFVRSKGKSVGKPETQQAHSTDVSISVPAPAASRPDQTKDDLLPGAVPLAMFRRPRSYSRRRPSTDGSHSKDNNIEAGPQQRQPRQPSRQEAVTVASIPVYGSSKHRSSGHVYERPRSYSRRRPTKSKSTVETGETGNKRPQQSSRAHQRIAQEHERVGDIYEQTDKAKSDGTTPGNPKLPEPERDRPDRQLASQSSNIASREDLGQSGTQHTGRTPVPAPVNIQEQLGSGILQNESGPRPESSTKPSKHQSRAGPSSKVAQQPEDPTQPLKGKGRDQGHGWKNEVFPPDTFHVVHPDARDRGLPKPPQGQERGRDTFPYDNFHIIHPVPRDRGLAAHANGHDHERRHPDAPRSTHSVHPSAPLDPPTHIRAAVHDLGHEHRSFGRSSRRAEGRRAHRTGLPPDTRRARPADGALCERPRIVAPPMYRGRYRDTDTDGSGGEGQVKWGRNPGRGGKTREAEAY